VLGVGNDAGLDEVRAARRRLAKRLHPDHGGDAERMRELNEAFALAVHTIGEESATTTPAPTAPSPPTPSPAARPSAPRSLEQDMPSFTVAALPAVAYEALLVVTNWLGDVLVEEPPYLLDAHLHDPGECWCRLELIPEAGASMVGLTVVGVGGATPPSLDAVRDRYVAGLNDLDDWPADA